MLIPYNCGLIEVILLARFVNPFLFAIKINYSLDFDFHSPDSRLKCAPATLMRSAQLPVFAIKMGVSRFRYKDIRTTLAKQCFSLAGFGIKMDLRGV